MSKRTPTPLQKKAIDNVMSGKFKSKREAMELAGYSEVSVKRGFKRILNSEGAKAYLEQFDDRAKAKFGMGIFEKLQEIYLEGLEADRPWGKNDVIPDYKVRKDYADTISEMVQLLEGKTAGKQMQINFFMFDKGKRARFNKTFQDFVRSQAEEAGS